MFSLKEIVVRMGPAVKQTLKNAGKLIVKEAVSHVGDRAAAGLKSAPEKIDNFIDKKKKEAIHQVREEAEVFVEEQMGILERRVDRKIDEIERRMDAKIQYYYRVSLLFILMSIGALIILGGTLLFFFPVKR